MRYLSILALFLTLPLFAEIKPISPSPNLTNTLTTTGAVTVGTDLTVGSCIKTGTTGNPLSVNCDTSKNVQISSTIVANFLENYGAADGTAYYTFLSSMAASLPSGAEISNLLGRIRWYKGDNSNAILNGIEGVCSSDVADESITCRGASLRTYTAPGGTLRTSVGADVSARASYSGGTEITAESGTAFVGERIWMAPYFSDASIANVNNFHGLWIYNEATAKTVTNGIKLSGAGGTAFTNDINLQNGETIDNATNGLIKLTGNTDTTGGATIRDQATIVGSMTVVANKFSVGGSTLSVNNGRVNVGGEEAAGDNNATPGIFITNPSVAAGTAWPGLIIQSDGNAFGELPAIDFQAVNKSFKLGRISGIYDSGTRGGLIFSRGVGANPVEGARLDNEGVTVRDQLTVVSSTTFKGGVADFSILPATVNTSTFTATGFYVPLKMTAAAIKAYTPAAADLGGSVICSDCAVAYSVCIATGATIQGFRLNGAALAECK